MLKKIFSIFIIITLLVGTYGSVFAAELKTKLDVIQEASETKYLENDQGYISKTIVDSNEETGEVTIDLSLSNITNITTKEKYDNTEIFIIVDENIVDKEEKLNQYISYIETLSTKIFEKSSNTQIGIIGIKGTICDYEKGEDGKVIWGENDEGKVTGREENAEIVANLTKNSEDIKTKLAQMNTNQKKYYTNLQAAIKLANNSYSSNVNRLLICLYDDVPAISIGVCSSISYGAFSEYATPEEAIKGKHEKIAKNTKNEILKLKDNSIDFILLRPDDTSYDETWHSTTTGEKILEFDGSAYVKELYGTLDKPNYGKMYSLNNGTLEKIVTEYIYKDILENIRTDIKSAVVKEYFPKEIIENFDITFENEKVDTTKLSDSNYITWNVGDIEGNKTVRLQYKLKIKNMKNEELLNKVISTSEKTEIKYVNHLGAETTAVLTSCPKIKLSEIKEELTATVSYDPTTETTGKVTATITTNKKVNEVEGWTLSEDGKTLTKEYTENAKETVHLVDIDNMTKDVVIEIKNIIKEEPKQPEQPPKDDTTTTEKIPDAGVGTIIISFIVIAMVSIIICKKYIKYKDIK